MRRRLFQVVFLNPELTVAAPHGAAFEQEVEARQQRRAFRFVRRRAQQLLDFADFAVCLELWRKKPGIAEDAVRRAQIFRYQRIVAKLEGRAAARQVLELAARQRFAYALLGDCIQGGHVNVEAGMRGFAGLFQWHELAA